MAAIVFTAGAALAFSVSRVPTYAASADVLLSRQNLAAGLSGITDPVASATDYDRIAQTQAQLATAPAVVEITLRRARFPSSHASDFEARSSVTANPNADILTFEVQDESALVAKTLATEYARAYTVYRRQVDTTATKRALDELTERIRSIDKSDLSNAALLTSLRVSEQRLNTLEALQTSNASLVRPAQSADKVSPQPVRATLIGLFAGLLLGIAIAFLRNAFNSRIESADDVVGTLGLPLLARIPDMSRKQREGHDLAMLSEPDGHHAESYRALRTSIEFASLDGGLESILVTSAIEAEGKSTTAANLALAFARGGRNVILVDIDLRRPYLAKFFDLGTHAGLTDVALGQASLTAALAEIELAAGVQALTGDVMGPQAPRDEGPGLRVLPSGPVPPDIGEFVGSEALKGLLNQLSSEADIVIVDAPPLLRVNDALTLSSAVDAVLYVARSKVVRRQMLLEARRVLQTSPARVLGCVVTGVSVEEDPFASGYGYGYTTSNGAASITSTGAAAR